MSECDANEKKQPVIAIVGRPNVGKSSLFNAIIGRRLSIVHEMSGVTRDRVAASFTFNNRNCTLIDTGGLGMFSGESRSVGIWDKHIADQVECALEEADALIFVVNVQDGQVVLDEEVARKLHRTDLPVLLAVNKCDNLAFAEEAETAFSQLGFQEVFPVSCLHRTGIDSLVRAAFRKLDFFAAQGDAEPAAKPLRIAVVGRPNVGKSSLVNTLLGEERVIVSDVAGTTRDAIDIDFSIRCGGNTVPAVLVDTAGLRRKGKVDTVVEFFSSMRTETAIQQADLVLFLVEASKDGATEQDKKIAAAITRSGRSCIVVANKTDLCGGTAQGLLKNELGRTLVGMNYAPVVCISAKEKRNLNLLLDAIAQAMDMMALKVPTALLNRVLAGCFETHTPPPAGNGVLKLYYASMIGTRPPRFLLFVNDPKFCAPNYLNFLKNTLREKFDFTGMPIELELRARPKKIASFHTEKPACKPGKTDLRNSAARAAAARKRTAKKPPQKG